MDKEKLVEGNAYDNWSLGCNSLGNNFWPDSWDGRRVV